MTPEQPLRRICLLGDSTFSGRRLITLNHDIEKALGHRNFTVERYSSAGISAGELRAEVEGILSGTFGFDDLFLFVGINDILRNRHPAAYGHAVAVTAAIARSYAKRIHVMVPFEFFPGDRRMGWRAVARRAVNVLRGAYHQRAYTDQLRSRLVDDDNDDALFDIGAPLGREDFSDGCHLTAEADKVLAAAICARIGGTASLPSSATTTFNPLDHEQIR